MLLLHFSRPWIILKDCNICLQYTVLQYFIRMNSALGTITFLHIQEWQSIKNIRKYHRQSLKKISEKISFMAHI